MIEDKLSGDERNAVAVPELVRGAVTEFATHVGVDAEMLLAGVRFEVDGIGFWLQHHGPLDPIGVVLMVQVGLLADGLVAQPLAALLIQNATCPAALTGYFGLRAEENALVLCLRIDLQANEDGAEAIACAVYSQARSLKSAFEYAAGLAREMGEKKSTGETAFA